MTPVRALDILNILLVMLETNFWNKCAQRIVEVVKKKV